MTPEQEVEFDQVYRKYLNEFGGAPVIGFPDETLLKVLVEMKRALSGEREGDLTVDEFMKLPGGALI